MNYKQIYARNAKNMNIILKHCPDIPTRSGIYFLLREENGFRYAYIGQARNLLKRVSEHLSGYQHIDLSIRKHGLYTADNPCGYRIHWLDVPLRQLDEKEQHFIKKYANAGYQMRNATAGAQGTGKHGLDNAKPPKNYYDGKRIGKIQMARELKKIIDTHLIISLKKDTKTSQKALKKFYDMLDENNIV